MACPFLRRDESLSKQQSTDQVGSWQLEDELLDTADSDALSLTHLQMAIQLLTEPAVSFPISKLNFIYKRLYLE